MAGVISSEVTPENMMRYLRYWGGVSKALIDDEAETHPGAMWKCIKELEAAGRVKIVDDFATAIDGK